MLDGQELRSYAKIYSLPPLPSVSAMIIQLLTWSVEFG